MPLQNIGIANPLVADVNADGHALTNLSVIASAGTSGATPYSGVGTRFMYVPSKAALRFGTVDANAATVWDAANIGPHSFAGGLDAKASGDTSFCFGFADVGETQAATGDYSFAFGENNLASGTYSIAFGSNNTANGLNAVTIGNQNTAGAGAECFSIGTNCVATGGDAMALGDSCTSSGSDSFSYGHGSTASATNSMALGMFVLASGVGSVVVGSNRNGVNTRVNASGQDSFVLGTIGIDGGSNLLASGVKSGVVGVNVSATADGAIAIGNGITNSTTNSLELGMSDATKVRIDAAGLNVLGNLVVAQNGQMILMGQIFN